MLQLINLSTSDIDDLSVKELCETCSSICKHAFTYLGGVMTNHLLSEKTHLTKYRTLVLRYISTIVRIGSEEVISSTDQSDTMQVYYIDCMAINRNIIVAPFRLAPSIASCQEAGPTCLIKLISVIMNHALINLLKRPSFASHTRMLGNCIQKIDRYTLFLYHLFSQIPKEREYFVNPQTTILSVIMTVERKVEQTPIDIANQEIQLCNTVEIATESNDSEHPLE